jgi:NDP-sugar pyrophosphorylase family protein
MAAITPTNPFRHADTDESPMSFGAEPVRRTGTSSKTPLVREAVIMAGGKGVRLRPYTTLIPKPLVPIGDYSILEIVLRQLAARGFTKATLAIGHLGQLIRAYVGDGSQWGIEVEYLFEESPLGTIGPVVASLADRQEHFLVMNGDILTDIDYGHLLDTHIDSGASLTVATYQREHKVDFGVLDVAGRHVTRFREKPTYTYSVSMGVYAIAAKTLSHYMAGLPFGFDDLILDLLGRGEEPTSYNFNGFWLDIGRPDDYDKANAEFASLKSILLPGH